MRVVSITNTQKQRSKITCLEYVEDVYNDVEQIVPHSESDFKLTGLALNEAISYVNTSVVSDIVATWRGVSLWYDVYLDDVFYKRVYTDSIKVFFWNGSSDEKILFRNVKYEHYYSEDYF